MEKIDKWEQILNNCRELTVLFNDLVFIGGIAVYQHTLHEKEMSSLCAKTHDIDFLISQKDFLEMEDSYDVVANKRLSKSQLIIDDTEADIYVEKKHSLRIPFDEILENSSLKKDIRVASLSHLIILKYDAFIERAIRKPSQKGEKDKDDLFKLLMLKGKTGEDDTDISKYIDEEFKNHLQNLSQDNIVANRIAKGNHHIAKHYKSFAQGGFHEIFSKKEFTI